MTDLQSGLILLLLSGAVGWGISIQEKVTKMQAVIDKLDQLITLILENHLVTPHPRSESQDDSLRPVPARVPYENHPRGENR